MAANTPASRIVKLSREHALAYPQTTELAL